MSKPKTTTVFAGTPSMDDILNDVLSNESTPTAAAAGVEGKADEPVYIPPAGGSLPTLPGGAGPSDLAAAGLEPDGALSLTPAEGADQTFALLVTLGRMLGDEEWEPDSADEEQSVKKAMERVFAVRGTPNLPPELGLALVLGRYVQKRSSRPKTKARLRSWLGSLPLPGFIRAMFPPADDQQPKLAA